MLRITLMFRLLLVLLCVSSTSFGQWKDFQVNSKGDTLNRVDRQGKKQGIWVNHMESLRGEPGYEEEGYYVDDRKEGAWRLFNLMGDMVGKENYHWGFKDGVCQYFSKHGDLVLEQGWKALNPDKVYDTIIVEDVDKLDTYHKVVVKNEGASLKHGTWKYYDSETGTLVRTENYTLGKADANAGAVTAKPTEKKTIAKPKEVLEFEKKAGKKKIKVQDGSTGG
jgi:antitoxin component YwqK of YwqJK toxin-antitoxin module